MIYNIWIHRTASYRLKRRRVPTEIRNVFVRFKLIAVTRKDGTSMLVELRDVRISRSSLNSNPSLVRINLINSGPYGPHKSKFKSPPTSIVIPYYQCIIIDICRLHIFLALLTGVGAFESRNYRNASNFSELVVFKTNGISPRNENNSSLPRNSWSRLRLCDSHTNFRFWRHNIKIHYLITTHNSKD